MRILILIVAVLSVVPARGEGVTYRKDIAPLISKKCLSCHGEKLEGAPFSLTTFESVSGRAQRIRSAVQSRRMPPFLVDTSGTCGEYSNISYLTDNEIRLITDWVVSGTPEGIE